jgi:predicted regulator of Ras-like GTPase activity (Roadblock/LC7/MglB family)
MATTTELLGDVVNDLAKVKDVRIAVIVSRDGLLMVSSTSPDFMTQTFAAMSATMFIAAEAATKEIGKWMPDRLVATSAGSKALLVIMTEPHATLGMLLIEMEKASEKVKEIVK